MKNNLLLSFLFFFLPSALPGAQPDPNLIPQPTRIEYHEGHFLLSDRTPIRCPDFPALGEYLSHHIEAGYGFRPGVNFTPADARGEISLTRDAALGAEAYRLQITPTGIAIQGGGHSGLFYGIQTLLQLMPPAVYGGPGSVPATPAPPLACLAIEDAPRYPYRGVMLDVSRTFSDKETVLRYIDWMGRHKINKLHWHLSDDDGWRIEIKAYPELTAKGAWRGPGEVVPPSYGSGQKRYGGYYTQDEIREVVAYAAFRGIEIIPEIDLPGHSRAARGAYPEIFCKTPREPEPELMRNIWCAGREENYEMIRGIFTELAALFPSSYLHIGGDEVNYRYWRECPRCQAVMRREGIKTYPQLQGYFMSRLEAIAHELGKRCGAWNEITTTNPGDTTFLIYGWENTDACRQALAKGYSLVAMPAQYCYIDMKQGPGERGHTWAWLVDTRRLYSFDPGTLASTPAAAARIRGVEGAMFAELLGKPERFLEYQGYPRICALSEVGWSQPLQRNWDDFYARLTGGHFPRLAAMGISFRVFPPAISLRGDSLIATTTLPETRLEYTTDPDPLTARYKPYTGPMIDTAAAKYFFRANYRDGAAFSPGVPAAQNLQVTLNPRETRTIPLPLGETIRRDGLWLLAVVPESDNTRIDRLEISGPDTTYTIIRNGQRANPFGVLRIYADQRNRTATARLTLSNNNATSNRVTISLRPSPFIEPPVQVSASFGFDTRFPVGNLTDYNFGSYSRSNRPCREGDYILFTFKEPVACRSIHILTGIPDITRYLVTRGSVDYSSDGVAYTKGGTIDDFGEFILYPEVPVKTLRIRVLGGNGESHLSLQDLRIRKD